MNVRNCIMCCFWTLASLGGLSAQGGKADQSLAYLDSLVEIEANWEPQLMRFQEQAVEEQNWPTWTELQLWKADMGYGSPAFREGLEVLMEQAGPQLPADHPLWGKVYHGWGDLMMWEESYDSTRWYFQQALIAYERDQDWAQMVSIQIGLAATASYESQWSEMEQALLAGEAVALTHLGTEDEQVASLDYLFGIVYANLGDYDLALEKALQSLERNQEGEQQAEQVDALAAVALAYHKKADYERAVEYQQQAIDLFQQLGLRDTASWISLLNSKVASLYRMEEFDAAVATGSQAIALDPIDQFVRLKIDALSNLAMSHLAREETSLTLQYCRKALALSEANQGYRQKILLHNLANALRLSGQEQAAIPYYESVIELHQRTQDVYHPNLAKAYRHLGLIARNQGRWAESQQRFDQAMRVLAPSWHVETSAFPPLDQILALDNYWRLLRDQAQTEYLLAHEEKKEVHLGEALRYYQELDQLIVTMYRTQSDASVRFWASEAAPIYDRAIEVVWALTQHSQDQEILRLGLHFAEQSKAVLLRTAYQEANARQQVDLPPAVYEHEQQLKRNLGFYQQKARRLTVQLPEDDERLIRTRQKVFQLRRELEDLENEIAVSYPDYATQKEWVNAALIADIQQQLKQESASVWVYAWGGTHPFRFELHEAGIQLHRLTSTDSLQRSIATYRRFLSDFSLASEQALSPELALTYAQTAYALGQDLCPAGALPRKVIIIPDGGVSFLPFESLVTEEIHQAPVNQFAELRYAIQQTSFRYEYSLALMEQSLRTNAQQGAGMLAFAPAYDPAERYGDKQWQVSSLPNNEAEAENAVQWFAGETRLGTQATKSRFLEEVDAFQLLHLAMHAVSDPQEPLQSGLIFSSTGEHSDVLYAHELYALRLGAELAVLSACETGTGQWQEGEGVMSLARAFKQAGVANVLMSLWQAEDQSTQEIMGQFYAQLRQGMGKAEALRAAKLTYLREARVVHPFFWSSFVLVGNDQPVQFQAETSWQWYVWVILGGLIGGVGSIWYRQRERNKR
ncbi:MAG: CHAT domain-containing tetratricopeptide repeat protein [Bacteroidota bacterium]